MRLSYTSNTGNGYYGAYQFNRGTWASVADPSKYGNATPAEHHGRPVRLKWDFRTSIDNSFKI
ncbi:transglycosylase family protein [Candidatus Minimicrobia naudis]